MKSFGLAALIFGTCAALLPMSASGQTMAPRAGQVAPAPHPAQAAPSPRAAEVAPAKPQPPAGAAKATAAKIRVPANLFKLKDTEIIFVGGKQTTAGAVRQDLKAQMLRAAGAPKLVRVASLKRAGQAKMVISPAAAALLAPHKNDSMPAVIDCTQQAPTILKIEGTVASGQQFTLIGNCFGDQNGDVKLIGQFPGGNLHVSTDPVHPGVTFTQWSAGRIVAALPAVTGSPDQTVAISVTTHANNRESTAKQANFVAARERVEVPARLWTPGAHFESNWNDTGDPETNPNARGPTPFSVTVNPACYLDTMEANATMGKVGSITGWTDGPPNASTVQIDWAYQETITSYWYSAVDDVYEGVSFDVKAWAYCPVGIAP